MILLTMFLAFLHAGVNSHEFVGRDLPGPHGEDVQGAAQMSPREIFQAVERGITSGTIGSLSPLFGKQVSMTIRGSESGVFSSAQALTILKNYFSGKKPAQFSFTRVVDGTSNPYATGRMTFVSRGNKESVQVYVSLTRQDSDWVLSQFNLY
ncbi:MAG: DUF4783 domain-containing protein [Ignavibacteriales bacterium]|nr:DUF4783 domain-containing protein [Ignavibacteriales bacterium]